MIAIVKGVMTAIGLVLVLIGIASILLYSRVAELGVSRVEEAASEAFDTAVTIERVATSPLNMSIDLVGVTVANPESFNEGSAIACDRIHLEFDPSTLFSEHPVVRRMELIGADIDYRYELGDGINIGVLARQAAKRAADENRPKVIVEEMVCEDAKVHFSTSLLPLARVGLDLVSINLKDVAQGEPIGAPKIASVFLRSVIIETLTLNGLADPIVKPLQREIEEITGLISGTEKAET